MAHIQVTNKMIMKVTFLLNKTIISRLTIFIKTSVSYSTGEPLIICKPLKGTFVYANAT